MTKAFLLGFIAGASGLDDDSCPYLHSEKEYYDQWLLGWYESIRPNSNPMQNIMTLGE